MLQLETLSCCGYEKEPIPLLIDRNDAGTDWLQPAGAYAHTERQPLTQRNDRADHPQSNQNEPTQPEPFTHTYTGHKPDPQPNPTGLPRAKYAAALQPKRNQLLECRIGLQAGRMAGRKCQRPGLVDGQPHASGGRVRPDHCL